MKRTRIMGLCLIAICAVFAFAATSAVATEGSLEYGKCTKVKGPFKNGGCTKLAKGAEEEKWSWTPLGEFVGTNSLKKAETGNAVLEAASGNEISCTGQKQLEGGYGPGKYEVKDIVGEFSGCKALGNNCNSAGKGEGFVDTLKLHGEPGTVTKVLKEEKNIDGNDLRGQATEFLAEFSCGPAPVKVKGGVVVKTTGATNKSVTNKMLNKVEVLFRASKVAKQDPEKWTPGGHGVSNAKHEEITEFLEGSIAGGAYEKSAQSLITVQKTDNTKVKVELRQCEKNIC